MLFMYIYVLYPFPQSSGSKFLHSVAGTNRGKPYKAPLPNRYMHTPKQLHSLGTDAAAAYERLPGTTLDLTTTVVSVPSTLPSPHYRMVTIQQRPRGNTLGSTVTFRAPVMVGPPMPMNVRQQSAYIHHGIIPGVPPRPRFPVVTTTESTMAKFHRQIRFKGGVISITPLTTSASTTVASSSVNPLSSSVGISSSIAGVSADVSGSSAAVNVKTNISSTTKLVSSSLTNLLIPVTSTALASSSTVYMPVPQKGDSPSTPIVIDDDADDNSSGESYRSGRHIEVVVTQANELPISTSDQRVDTPGDGNMLITQTTPDGMTMSLDQHGDYVIRMPPEEMIQCSAVNDDVLPVSEPDIVKSSGITSVRPNVDMDAEESGDDDVDNVMHANDDKINDENVHDDQNDDVKHADDPNDVHDQGDVINDVRDQVMSDHDDNTVRDQNDDNVVRDQNVGHDQINPDVINVDNSVFHDVQNNDDVIQNVDNRDDVIGPNVSVASVYDAVEGEIVSAHLDQIIEDVAHGRDIQDHSQDNPNLDVTILTPDVPDNLPVDVARDLQAIFTEMDEVLAQHSHITLEVDPNANMDFHVRQVTNDPPAGDLSILDVEMSPVFRGVTVDIGDAIDDAEFTFPDDQQQHD